MKKIKSLNDKRLIVECQLNGEKALFLMDTGATVEDTNAFTFTITCEDTIPAPFYTGKIATNDGDISGATGEVSPSLPEE